MSNVQSVTDQNFESVVLQSQEPVLVDFWAAWCGPCRALAPKIDEIASEYSGRVKVVKMDVDANQKTPAQFGIRGIPALLYFKGGKMVDQVVGNQPKDVIQSLVNKGL